MKNVLLYQTTTKKEAFWLVNSIYDAGEPVYKEDEIKIPVIQHPPIVKKASSKRPLVLFAPVGKMNSSVSCEHTIMTAIL